jgi:transposase-like protein
MSKKTRRRLDTGLKAKVALGALRNEATIAELAAKYQLRPTRSTRGRSSCSTAARLCQGNRIARKRGRR